MTSEYTDGDVDATSSEKKGRYCSSSADAKESCWILNLIRLFVCLLCGVVFGVALHKAHGSTLCSSQ